MNISAHLHACYSVKVDQVTMSVLIYAIRKVYMHLKASPQYCFLSQYDYEALQRDILVGEYLNVTFIDNVRLMVLPDVENGILTFGFFKW